jgi:hypothetical protein
MCEEAALEFSAWQIKKACAFEGQASIVPRLVSVSKVQDTRPNFQHSGQISQGSGRNLAALVARHECMPPRIETSANDL